MESSCVIDKVIAIFECVEGTRCLCLLKRDRELFDIYFNTLWSNLRKEVGADVEHGLLCVSILREAADIFICKNVENAHVCEGLPDFLEVFSGDEIWNRIVKDFQEIQDKYLRYALSKSLAALMNSSPLPLFKVRLGHIVGILLEAAADDDSSSTFELLISLADYKTKMVHSGEDSPECKNPISCPGISLEDNFLWLCTVLSNHWHTFMDLFVRSGNPNVDAFLCLWKLLCEKSLNRVVSSVFLNVEFALEFPSISLKLSSIPLRLYAEVITQILCSSLKPDSWKHVLQKTVKDAVIPTISGGILNSISMCYQTSTFFTVSQPSSACQMRDGKIDIVAKRVIFIFLNLISEIRSSTALCESLRKVFIALASPAMNWKSKYTHAWVVDTFIEEDDLLFGVMLSLLRIYCTLREVEYLRFENSNDLLESCKNELNPHTVFIKFLQQIGNDNNELLSFLLSDETCCLLYLMQYLKLLLLEWRQFIEAHKILLQEENVQECEGTGMHSIPDDEICAKKLVSYSSSSSSEEEPENSVKMEVFAGNTKRLSECALKTVWVLISLKEAVQKLVDVKEFPYNAAPLLNLLEMCSEKSSSLT